MRRLQCVLLATAAIGFVSVASAADMPVKARPMPVTAAYNWTGFYLGADVGYGWTRQNATVSDPASAPGNGDIRARGVIGGLYLGYNWALAPNFVVGIEGDFTGADLNDTATDLNRNIAGVPLAGGITFEHRVHWLSTLRGRLGYTVTPTLMLYGTGGGALASVRYHTVDIHVVGPAFPVTFDSDKVRGGWVVGGGAEWAWTHNWLLRAEYLHYDIAGDSASGIPRVGFPGELSNFTFNRLQIDTVRVGAAYKF